MSARREKRAAARQGSGTARSARPAAAARGPSLAVRAARQVRRHPGATLAAVLGIYLLFALLSFEPQPHSGGDNAGYLSLARSLLERHAYLDLYDPAEAPHTKYPPAFPALLALALALGVKPWVGLKLLVMTLGGGAIAATFLWIRRRGQPLLALAVALLLALAPGALREVHWVLSDVPFWCFTAFALWGWERLRPGDWRRFALALGCTVLAYFTRSAGLPLALAAFAWLAARRRWPQLAVFALVLGPLALLWWLRARAVGGVEYVGEFWMVNPYQPELGTVDAGGLLLRLRENLARYLGLHLPILLSGGTAALSVACGAAAVAFGIYGWGRRLRRARVAELFLPLYLGLILLWPAVWSGERFLLPVLGLLLAYGGEGLLRATRRLGRRAAFGAGAAAFALLLLVALPGLVYNVRLGHACTSAYLAGERYPCVDPATAEYLALAHWTADNLPADAVVLSRKPRLFYIASGLRGRPYPMASTTEALLASADSAGAQWVVFDGIGSLAARYLAPAILQRPQAFCVLQASASQGTILFQIRPGAAALPDAPPSQGGAAGFEPCAPGPGR